MRSPALTVTANRPVAVAVQRMLEARRKVPPITDENGRLLGVADYFVVDVTLVRLVWLVVALVCPPALLGYVVAWIVIPTEPELLPAPPATAQPSATT